MHKGCFSLLSFRSIELIDVLFLIIFNCIVFVKNNDATNGVVESDSRNEFPNQLVTWWVRNDESCSDGIFNSSNDLFLRILVHKWNVFINFCRKFLDLILLIFSFVVLGLLVVPDDGWLLDSSHFIVPLMWHFYESISGNISINFLISISTILLFHWNFMFCGACIDIGNLETEVRKQQNFFFRLMSSKAIMDTINVSSCGVGTA